MEYGKYFWQRLICFVSVGGIFLGECLSGTVSVNRSDALITQEAGEQNPHIITNSLENMDTGWEDKTKAVIFDTGEADYSYLSWVAEDIYADVIADKLMEKYGDVSKMPEITVGILDTGVDYTHSFLKDRINSYQYDFVDKDGDAMDENKHGTHIAGVIADLTFPNVKINAYRVANEKGEAYIEDVISGIDQAIKDKVDIINISLGAEMKESNKELPKMKEILDKAVKNNIIIVVAVGNGNSKGVGFDAKNIWPACYLPAISVASVNEKDQISKFSNYGSMVDFCAPGEKIYSTVLNNDYANSRGTSISCPFVTASAALLLTYDPSLTYQEVTKVLEDTATDLGEPGYDIYYGYGKVNLLNFETAVEDVLEQRKMISGTGAPDSTGTTGTASADEGKKEISLKSVTCSSLKNNASGQMKVTFSKNSKADGYQIQYTTDNSFHKKTTVTIKSNLTTNQTIKNLKKGKTYYVRVRCYKKSGGKKYVSAWSKTKSVIIKK